MDRLICRVPIEEVLAWSTGKRTLREALVDIAADTPWLRDAERRADDAGGDFWRDRCLQVRAEGGEFAVYLLVEDMLTLRLDDDRPLCPKCGTEIAVEGVAQ